MGIFLKGIRRGSEREEEVEVEYEPAILDVDTIPSLSDILNIGNDADNKKITNLAEATNPNDAVRFNQFVPLAAIYDLTTGDLDADDNIDVSWSYVFGDTPLDLTEPSAPVVNKPGVYVVCAYFDLIMSINKSFHVILDLFGITQFKTSGVQSNGGKATVSLSGCYYASVADLPVNINVENDDSISHTFNGIATVIRLGP